MPYQLAAKLITIRTTVRPELPDRVKEGLQQTFQEASPNQFSLCSFPNVIQALERRFPSIFLVPHFRELLIARLQHVATCNEGLLCADDFIAVMTESLTHDTSNWGGMKTPIGGGLIGLGNLPDQITSKLLKRGFDLNVMLVGRSGLGKSTLVDTLFKAKVSRRSSQKSTEGEGIEDLPRTTEIHAVTHVLEEQNVKVRLTVTDTPGYGDHLNNQNCWVPIMQHISEQYERYLIEERQVVRKRIIPDSRIHVILYFIEPSGHRLSQLDIECLRRLTRVANVIPVIAKSDTLTLEERVQFKHSITEDLIRNQIQVYLGDEDEGGVMCKDIVPFCVVGSTTQHEVGGKFVFGRATRWGVIECENKAHCEFTQLRDLLIKSNMGDLVEKTHFIHYENFRHQRLKSGEPVLKMHHNGNSLDHCNESTL